MKFYLTQVLGFYTVSFYTMKIIISKTVSIFSFSFIEFLKNQDVLNLLKFWEKVIDEAEGLWFTFYFISMQNIQV